jgi:hypothetical protein
VTDVHENYLRDLGDLIRRHAGEAKEAVARSQADDLAFQQGRLMAYAEVVSLMQQQAAAFDLPLIDVALDGFDPERDLL